MPTSEDEFPEVVGDWAGLDEGWVARRDPIAEPFEKEVTTVETPLSDDGPYLMTTVVRTLVAYRFNKKYDHDAKCADPNCGHPYYRHFDTYENMSIVGCKYCPCFWFKEKEQT